MLSRLVPAALVMALAPVLLGGCEANTCEYGSEGSSPSDCKERPEPTAAEADGYHAASLESRIDEFEASGADDRNLVGVTVNRWGEVAFLGRGAGGDELTAYSVDNETIDMSDETLAEGDTTFPLSDVRADALDRATEEGARLHPGYPFVKGELSYQPPRTATGLDFSRRYLGWEVTVGAGSDYVYYETDADGRILCERVGGASECTKPG